MYCLTCHGGSMSENTNKQRAEWITKHLKNENCKEQHTHAYKMFVQNHHVRINDDTTTHQHPITNQTESVKYKKKPIPAPLRNMVWDGNIGRTVGESVCLCCEKTVILQRDFHCGHIIAEVEGGKTVYENLLPICKVCNTSMGKKNMRDFKKEYGFGNLVDPKPLRI